MNASNLEVALLETMAKENLNSIVFDAGELAIDSLLTGGIVEEIPFFGVMVKSYNAVNSVRDQLFSKKMWLFLSQVSQLNPDERKALLEKLELEKGGSEKVGTSILMLVEKLDDMSKPTMIGELFKTCSKGEITASQLFKLSNIIERTFIDDITSLSRMGDGNGYSHEEQQALIEAGLMVPSLEKNPLYIDIGNLGEHSGGFAGQTDDTLKKIKLTHKFSPNAILLAKILFNAGNTSYFRPL